MIFFFLLHVTVKTKQNKRFYKLLFLLFYILVSSLLSVYASMAIREFFFPLFFFIFLFAKSIFVSFLFSLLKLFGLSTLSVDLVFIYLQVLRLSLFAMEMRTKLFYKEKAAEWFGLFTTCVQIVYYTNSKLCPIQVQSVPSGQF